MNQNFEKRKKVIYDFICDDMYVPMKIKEIAIVLQIPKMCIRDSSCKANAKSIVMLIAQGLGKGVTAEISAEGEDEKEAVEALAALIKSKFGED